ncbi:MAG: SRPBCC family protein [Pseudomonadales bacterium]|nr:SRPBCC family protein [Pseudomonadales bacterium]
MARVEVIETVNADASAVWGNVGNFGGIEVGGPVTAFDLEGEGVGAVRTISMGPARIVERLEAYDDAAMALKYAIINDDCPLPVSNYSATINVAANADGGCTVTWVGNFEPKGAPEEAACEVVRGIYTGGIARARQATGG